MCGIFGYMGGQSAPEKVLEGLKRLEYRGYDSWGIAASSDKQVKLVKKTGKIGDVSIDELNFSPSNVAIGHTRWATTGEVSDANAHPHCSSDKTFVLAHNGIVENYEELKEELASKGHKFSSETDTEVIVRLIEEKLKTEVDFKTAVKDAFKELEGRNTILILTNSNSILALRNGSPLVVGMDEKTGDIYLSSDTLSFSPFVQKITVAENNQMICLEKGSLELHDIISGKKINPDFEKLNIKSYEVDKEGFDHFMIKEINESPFVIRQVFSQTPGDYQTLADAIKKARNVYTVGSGTAGLAAAQTAYYLRAHGKIKAISLIGGDSAEYFDLLSKDDILIAPSQSGETADVLEVLELAKSKGVKIASYVNMQGSAMTRLSDFKFMADAGPEMCVMSTKIFVSQIAWGYLLAKTVQGKYQEGKQNLSMLSEKLTQYFADENAIKEIEKIAGELTNAKDIFLMGKSQNIQMVHEGMVKMIEGTYKHAHSIPAGDLKHYAITLIEKNVPVIAAISNDKLKTDLMNSIGEVKARGAKVIAICPEKDKLFDRFIKVPDTGETSGIMNVIPLQLLSYYMGVKLGNSVDKPRNIAKSVTVK